MSAIESRLFFLRPDNTITTQLRNQRSGVINTPESATPVPAQAATLLIEKNKAALDKAVDYVRIIAEQELRTAQITASLVPEEKFSVQPRGAWVDTYV